MSNRNMGEIFDVSLSAVTKAVLRLNKRMRTQRGLRKRVGIIFYSLHYPVSC